MSDHNDDELRAYAEATVRLSIRLRVLLELADERERQDRRWGPEHDDQHGDAEWAWLITRRAVDLAHPWDDAHVDRRRELVEIAAIATAAIESYDRRNPPE